MAIMIPSTIAKSDYPAASREGDMFRWLRDGLDDSFYVFYSYRIVNVINSGAVTNNESDFLIFNPSLGLLVVEAKNGPIYCTDGIWYYGSGIPMKKSPFDQAVINMYKLKEFFDEKFKSNLDMLTLLHKCKLSFCVWLPSYTKADIAKMDSWPSANTELILTKEDSINPQPDVIRIMKLKSLTPLVTVDYSHHESENENNISAPEGRVILKDILGPEFGLMGTNNSLDSANEKFFEMTEEQKKVLNYLDGQRSVAISGIGGSGKTFLAIECARRVPKNEKVLFICFNKRLQEHLEKTNSDLTNVTFKTIDYLTLSLANAQIGFYGLLNSKIEEMIMMDKFPYSHVVIDEGQDMGRDDIEKSGVLKTLFDFCTKDSKSSFYIFYDENQLVQSEHLPSVISHCESKISLYQNCRNTFQIAKASISLFPEKSVERMTISKDKGDPPRIYYYETQQELEKLFNSVAKTIKKYKGYSRVILTCKTKETSDAMKLEGAAKGRFGDLSSEFYSFREFKGLERDIIIVTDVDESVLLNDTDRSLYVAESRAKLNLFVFAKLSDAEAKDVLDKRFPEEESSHDIETAKRELAGKLNCFPLI